MKAIPFTRFTLPNGRQSPDSIEVSDQAAAKFEEVQQAGCRMTVELLRTGQVSIAIELPSLGDFDMELCANEPDQPRLATERILERFNLAEFGRWVEIIQTIV